MLPFACCPWDKYWWCLYIQLKHKTLRAVFWSWYKVLQNIMQCVSGNWNLLYDKTLQKHKKTTFKFMNFHHLEFFWNNHSFVKSHCKMLLGSTCQKKRYSIFRGLSITLHCFGQPNGLIIRINRITYLCMASLFQQKQILSPRLYVMGVHFFTKGG